MIIPMYNLYKDLSMNCHIHPYTPIDAIAPTAWSDRAGACALSGFSGSISGSGICPWRVGVIQQVMAAFRVSSFPLQSFHKAASKAAKAAKARSGASGDGGVRGVSCTGGQGYRTRTVSFRIANGAWFAWCGWMMWMMWMRQLCQLGVGMLHLLHLLRRLHRQILLALTSLLKNSTSPAAPKSHWGWPRAVLVDNAGLCTLCTLCFYLARTWRTKDGQSVKSVKSGTCTVAQHGTTWHNTLPPKSREAIAPRIEHFVAPF